MLQGILREPTRAPENILYGPVDSLDSLEVDMFQLSEAQNSANYKYTNL